MQLKPNILLAKIDYHHLLTKRELEVLRLINQGKNNQEIAQALYLTEGTVRNYVSHILNQLGLRDRIQAVIWMQHLS